MAEIAGFTIFHRTDGSEVAFRTSAILFIGRGERGAVLNFAGGTQVNVHEDFDAVIGILTAQE